MPSHVTGPLASSSLGALREPVLGPGLATALNTLRAKGDLKEKFEWVGRTNDMKKVSASSVTAQKTSVAVC